MRAIPGFPNPDWKSLRQKWLNATFRLEPELDLPFDLQRQRQVWHHVAQPRPGGDDDSSGFITAARRRDARISPGNFPGGDFLVEAQDCSISSGEIEVRPHRVL